MDKLGEALVALVVLSIIIERGLAIIFDTKAFRLTGDQKAMIAIGVSAAICFLLNFDVITLIPKVCADCGFGTNRLPPWVGTLLTGFVVAGGSAGAVKLFQDVLGFRRSIREERTELTSLKVQADIAEAKAKLITSGAGFLPSATPASSETAERLANRYRKVIGQMS